MSAPLGAQFEANASLRADLTHYAYDNRMRDGNVAEDGTPCSFGGCLYARSDEKRF